MRAPGEIWRQRLWVWVPALLFFLANAGAFAVYKLGFAGNIASLDDRLKELAQQNKELADKSQQAATMIDRVRTNEAQVEQLYTDRLSTRSQRLTTINDEVKKLAREAGLQPKAITYPEQEIEEYNLIKRSFVFSVEGTYAELRKFVSLLETSRSFLSIEEATVVNNTEGKELRIDLTLSTLFANDADAPPMPAAAPAARAASTASARPAPGGAE
jgi:type IV pilus assembly protein PilO